ncbi:MAG: hypothetical protein OEQ53_10990, partial [Saprospiraceae bacterium]|nr:hypothetical protein [Saprospiraceae bacterium]
MRTNPAKQAPEVKVIEEIKIPAVHFTELQNGIPVCFMEGGTQPLVRLDLQLKAGRPFETRKLVATACSSMLKEGTES